MHILNDFAQQKVIALNSQELHRTLVESPGSALNFCSNDYLGLSKDARVVAAAIDATQHFGVGAGASRLVTGNHSLYARLERKIAEMKETEAALVFGSGYLANLGTIPAVVGVGDLVLLDELCHACMISGARLSGAKVQTFRHNDMQHLEGLLQRERGSAKHCLLMTEGVFSMDGDLAPLASIGTMAQLFDAWTLVDDAHGLGVTGGGRGSAAHWNVRPDIQVGTLSKAVGSYGGFVAASQAVVDLLVNRSRTLIYSTALPASVLAASLCGLEIIEHETELPARALENARMFARELNLAEPRSAIIPLFPRTRADALDAARRLEAQGYIVKAIRPPTVPAGTDRLRVTLSAVHTRDEILSFAAAIRALNF